MDNYEKLELKRLNPKSDNVEVEQIEATEIITEITRYFIDEKGEKQLMSEDEYQVKLQKTANAYMFGREDSFHDCYEWLKINHKKYNGKDLLIVADHMVRDLCKERGYSWVVGV